MSLKKKGHIIGARYFDFNLKQVFNVYSLFKYFSLKVKNHLHKINNNSICKFNLMGEINKHVVLWHSQKHTNTLKYFYYSH